MNGYIAFYDQLRIEIFDETLYGAEQKAVQHFRPTKKKRGLLHVRIAEKDVLLDADGKYISGTPVFHSTVDF
ncbi:hypothetical protein PQR34_46340 [Paraburkholderia sediminicola]|uniref:hypothetical protein n=1 Tax=Paraburkholderia sediminicola TaxID=458836 RepID=UPI0038B8A16D